MTGEQNHDVEFQRLIERRRKFIDALDANRGEINLDIFEDFYPDRAHFVYELLQNAEDACATKVAFTLTPEQLICEHDGRPFTIADVTSITGIHDSTKTKAQDKIGKFGVGFKSVFVYTLAPVVRSGNFAFRIVKQVLPEKIASDTSPRDQTRFEFPFDNPKKPPEESYEEIAAGLSGLDEKTLLFLSNLQSVKWQIGRDTHGQVVRNKHSEFHFEVLRESGGRVASSTHFLKFDEAVPGLDKQRIAVAFPLDLLPGISRFEQGKPLADQLKIIPAEPGNVAVFFPAVNETSGLRFHLHGPFVPAMSRASLKETDANTPLFEQIASLAAQTLHRIKEFDLLTLEFLSVLPNPQDQIPPRYKGIREAIIDEMKIQPLTPTYERKHAPASQLIQARASLKELLSEPDIEFLVDYDDAPPLWAIGATQRNSRIDNFLTGLGIRDWGLDRFVETLRKRAREEEGFFPTRPDANLVAWLKQKSPSWMQEFYSLLHDEASLKSHLTSLCVVRLADGTLSRADRAFFAAETTSNDVPIVDMAVYSSGTSKKQQDSAKHFLSQIGVRDIGKAEEVELILRRRYTKEAELPADVVYLDDLKRFIALTEEKPDAASLFSTFYIFQADNDYWYQPGEIYIDKPFADTCLSAYYKALKEKSSPQMLHARYRECGIEAKSLIKFAEAVGVKVRLGIIEDTCYKNPNWQYLASAGGGWTAYGINRDYFIPKLGEIFKTPSLELSRLVWKTLTSMPLYPDYLQATFRNNTAHSPRMADSRLVHQLRDACWIPQNGGQFVRPADALRGLLPEGFPFDPGFRWLKPIQFGEAAVLQSGQSLQKDAAAKSLGFADAASAERARRFNELPVSEQESILGRLEHRDRSAVPDRPLANPERRSQSVREQAMKAIDKESEIRERSVSIGKELVKEQADAYLREHYRNSDAEMTCQICKGPLPFRLEDGREYFEVVEFLPELIKRHSQNYLALCPNHSAMYRLVNGSKDTVRDAFRALNGNELLVELAEKEFTIYFSKTHILDLLTVLEAEEDFRPQPEAEEFEDNVQGSKTSGASL